MFVNIFLNWSLLSIIGCVSIFIIIWYLILCGGLYYMCYVSQYKETALGWKTQMKIPSNDTVKKEIIDGCISSMAASVNISLSIWLSNGNWNQLYGNFSELTVIWHITSLFFIWLLTEIFEWTFHWLSHNNKVLWNIHKKHHLFPNPTPFSVLSDHPLDMFIKSSPMLWLPLMFPVWDFTLLAWFGFVNFLYGAYLHSGFEFPFLPARDSQYLISSWHHNIHHTLHIGKNFGFFTRFMDIIFGTKYDPQDYIDSQKKRE